MALMACGEKRRPDGQEALRGRSSLKKCTGEHGEMLGYARPCLYDGYEAFATFLLKHHSRYPWSKHEVRIHIWKCLCNVSGREGSSKALSKSSATAERKQ